MKRLLLRATLLLALSSSTAFADDVLVGLGAPLTGPGAAFGDQFKSGVEAAAKAINASGGILGSQIKIDYGDDAGDPRQGVSVANKFVADGVKAVIGHFGSGVSIPASDVYEENGIIQITPSSTNPKLTDRGMNYIFRTTGRDDAMGAFGGKWLAANRKDKHIAILHDGTAGARGVADQVKKSLNEGGVTETLFEGIIPGEKDYTALVSKLKAANVDVIYSALYHTEAGLILRQANEQGFKPDVFASDNLATTDYWAIAGNIANGTRFTFAAEPKPAEGQPKPDIEKAEGFTLYAYAALQVYADAANKVGSLDNSKIAAYIKSGAEFPTAIGPIKYDQKGDVVDFKYIWYVWQNGSYAPSQSK